MSHGINPQHSSDNGRSDGIDDGTELPVQLSTTYPSSQYSHQSVQFSPIHQFVQSQQQNYQNQLPQHQQLPQEVAYHSLLQSQFRGCVDPNTGITYPNIYYPPQIPYLQIPFSPYFRSPHAQQQQQQPQQQQSQQPQQQTQQTLGNSTQELGAGAYSGGDISGSVNVGSHRGSYAQKTPTTENSESVTSFSAPGRGVPVQSSQPTMLQQQHHELNLHQPVRHHLQHQVQQSSHLQQLPYTAMGNSARGNQFKVSEYLPKFLTEVNPEKLVNEVNPTKFIEPHVKSRFFVIKSYSEEDVHRAIKYSIWCSSKKNNDILDKTFQELTRESCASSNSSAASTPSSTNADCDGSFSPAFLKDQPMIYLFFSVNGSGHFCGVSRLASKLFSDYNAGVWCQEKWTGLFYIRWLYVKDVPNAHLRHIRLQNNENKPVTNTRDGHEVDYDNGVKVLKVIHDFRYTTTLFDDYDHYDRLEEEKYRRRETQYNRMTKN